MCQSPWVFESLPTMLAATTANVNLEEDEKSAPPEGRYQRSDCLFIAVLGETGVGKSSFITRCMSATAAAPMFFREPDIKKWINGEAGSQMKTFKDALYLDYPGSELGDEKDGQERNTGAIEDHLKGKLKPPPFKYCCSGAGASVDFRSLGTSDMAAVARHAKLNPTNDLRKLERVEELPSTGFSVTGRWDEYCAVFSEGREASSGAHGLELSNDRLFGALASPARSIESYPGEGGKSLVDVKFLRIQGAEYPLVPAFSWMSSGESLEQYLEAPENSEGNRGDYGRDEGSNDPWSQPVRMNPDDDDNDDHFGFCRANCWEEPQLPDSLGQEGWSGWCWPNCTSCSQNDGRDMPALKEATACAGRSVSAATIAMWKAVIERTLQSGRQIRNAQDGSSASAAESWKADHAWSVDQLVLCPH